MFRTLDSIILNILNILSNLKLLIYKIRQYRNQSLKLSVDGFTRFADVCTGLFLYLKDSLTMHLIPGFMNPASILGASLARTRLAHTVLRQLI